MSNEKILKLAIEKAEGYKPVLAGIHYSEELFDEKWIKSNMDDGHKFYQIIFSHQFAKAFWGEDKIYKGKWVIARDWEIHIQKMVLEEDPIKYLEQFITKEK